MTWSCDYWDNDNHRSGTIVLLSVFVENISLVFLKSYFYYHKINLANWMTGWKIETALIYVVVKPHKAHCRHPGSSITTDCLHFGHCLHKTALQTLRPTSNKHIGSVNPKEHWRSGCGLPSTIMYLCSLTAKTLNSFLWDKIVNKSECPIF